MAVLPSAYIQRRPFAIPVEWYGGLTFIGIVQFLEVLVLDGTGTIFVEQPKSDFIFRIWLGEEVLECYPVLDINPTQFLSVSDVKEDRILFTLNLVLYN